MDGRLSSSFLEIVGERQGNLLPCNEGPLTGTVNGMPVVESIAAAK